MTFANGILTAQSANPGWLLVPADADERWIDETAAALRVEKDGPHADEPLLRLLLNAAREHRRDEDALFFQLWPTAAPVCVFVHAAVGAVDPATLPGAPDALPYEAAGLGPGIMVPFTQRVAETDIWGVEYVFHDGRQGVSVHVEATLPEILAPLMPAIHELVQSLRLTGDDGREFAAMPPALAENGADGSWTVA